MHDSIKKAMGFENDLDDKKILSEWKKRTSELCKPCWEIHYCPYGPLVEDFPLLPLLRKEAEEDDEYFNEQDYPEKIPKILEDASCRVFGHICPVFFVAEPLTETKNRRKHSRSIPRDVMLKVVRRDGQICQECNTPVADNEVEFDHIIPFSKGGRSTVENLRLIHKACNRSKSASLKKILSENPIEHLWELRKNNKKKNR